MSEQAICPYCKDDLGTDDTWKCKHWGRLVHTECLVEWGVEECEHCWRKAMIKTTGTDLPDADRRLISFEEKIRNTVRPYVWVLTTSIDGAENFLSVGPREQPRLVSDIGLARVYRTQAYARRGMTGRRISELMASSGATLEPRQVRRPPERRFVELRRQQFIDW